MTLDSRVLTHLSCYAKKFPKPGQVSYRLLVGTGACSLEDDESFTIEVSGRVGNQPSQHDVEVRFADRSLVAEPRRLEIRPGDVVLWHGANAAVPGFTVKGEGAGGGFDSGALADEVLYTHAFGAEGRYEWADAYGGPIGGVVEVVAPERRGRNDCEGWARSLAEGALVHIVKGKARPDRVRILPGQTVFWAVESAPGITITDRRLLPRTEAPPPRPPAKKQARARRPKGRPRRSSRG